MYLERCNDHDKSKQFLVLENLLEPRQLGFSARTHLIYYELFGRSINQEYQRHKGLCGLFPMTRGKSCGKFSQLASQLHGIHLLSLGLSIRVSF